MVEVEGEQRLVASCDTQVAEGIVVHTNSPRVREARRVNLRLLLAQHHPINISEAMRNNEDMHSEVRVVEKFPRRQLIRDIDDGKAIARRVADLQELLEAYRSGAITPKE
jgi:predicted molibdopterin-dependent oxidoreductase YjgC